eukprot:jgi/Botrbrau1/17555/Bobra.0166s0003.1
MDSSVVLLSIRDIRDLPFDVLIKILAGLDLSTLMMSRLVCNAFRKASIPSITCLRWNFSRFPISAAQSAHRLSVVSSITELHLGLTLPRDASMLALPAVLSALRSLTLEFGGSEEAVSRSWEAVVPRLAGATQLTALTIDRVHVGGGFGYKLVDSLRALTALEELALHAIPNMEAKPLAEAVSELSNLRKLRISYWYSRCLESAIRHLARMTRLQSLEWLAFPRSGDWENLRTQMPPLPVQSMSWATNSHSQVIRQLSRLTSLQVLRLPNTRYLSMDLLRQLVSPMTQLQELEVHGYDCHASGMDRLLACLPLMTKLGLKRSLWTVPWDPLPAHLLPNGFAGLRAVSLDIRQDELPGAVQLAKAFTLLESLKLTCNKPIADAFLSHLPCVRNLTELELVHCGEQGLPFTVCASLGSLSPAPAFLGLLPELQHLKRLALHDMVDNSDDAVRYLAALTGLTNLCIMQFQPAQPLTSAQVQPLTKLIWLKRLSSNRPFGAALLSPEFWWQLRGRQYELGIPRAFIQGL